MFRKRLLFVLMIGSVLMVSSARADTIYTYHGFPMAVQPGSGSNSCPAPCTITIITSPTPTLPANWTYRNDPCRGSLGVDFTITDGTQTFFEHGICGYGGGTHSVDDSSDYTDDGEFGVLSTDSLGNPSAWNVWAAIGGVTNELESSGASIAVGGFSGDLTLNADLGYYAYNTVQGYWTMTYTPEPTPEPSSLVLLGTSLVALGLITSRRLR